MCVTGKRNQAIIYTRDFTPEEIKQALLGVYDRSDPLDELICTGQAVFEFIRNSEMELDMKNAFYQLEKQFDFYKNLLLEQSA